MPRLLTMASVKKRGSSVCRSLRRWLRKEKRS
ncbi:hypothetical protein PPTG_24662 [Phytophthora nicotianae INRA-310]|uniref:Uncharacterized protein n=1 Tax=Phytophthora nicotianae (strain INRA-310) TaxID=761204 RepID=W2PE88_PHYN3|nr:hypothetical protein PPTG_24662 [Phytophthora nicotianae INRA-310]ETM98299.1 hypothetical protein PPTG_24662 [Phytophthora nicotianae INRA-310]